jgi:hypothetical protein
MREIVAMRTIGLGIGVLVLATAGGARADGFAAVAEGARALQGPRALAAVLWAELGRCGGDDELERRACEGVRAGRRAQLADERFVVAGDARSLELGAFDPVKRSAPLTVTACLACAQPVTLDGAELYVAGTAKVALVDGVVKPRPARETAVVFDSAAAYDAWVADTLPRLRREFVIVAAGAVAWTKVDAPGAAVEVLGWRVYDPCTGKVIASEPASADLAPDAKACGAEVAAADAEPATAEAAPTAPKLPYQLSTYDINRALAPVRAAGQRCLDAYGIPGKASFTITVSADGTIAKLVQTGDFTETPTGICLDKAVREVSFPAMQKASVTFDYPIVLR